MEILGYSERGIINSLFYEMKFSQNNLQLFSDFLSLFSFPYRAVNFQISDAKILIEQSFSDFGDADAVVLVENKSWKQAMFIEAKVRAFKNWQILIEFEKFTKTSEKIREKTFLFPSPMRQYCRIKIIIAKFSLLFSYFYTLFAYAKGIVFVV